MTTPHWIENLLACPSCSGELLLSSGAYTCRDCTRAYPIRYGIPDFRLEPDPYISYADEIRKIEARRRWERLRRSAAFRMIFGRVVPQYFVIGQRPADPPPTRTRGAAC